MDTGEFVRLVGALAVGALLTAFGSWLNHVFSTRTSERDRRASEIAYWRDFSDDYHRLLLNASEITALRTASNFPHDPLEPLRDQHERLENVRIAAKDLNAGTRRAPEALASHVRLFLGRVSRAYKDVPVDQEAANRALVLFRQALDEYVRRGRVAPPKPLPNESWPDSTY